MSLCTSTCIYISSTLIFEKFREGGALCLLCLFLHTLCFHRSVGLGLENFNQFFVRSTCRERGHKTGHFMTPPHPKGHNFWVKKCKIVYFFENLFSSLGRRTNERRSGQAHIPHAPTLFDKWWFSSLFNFGQLSKFKRGIIPPKLNQNVLQMCTSIQHVLHSYKV